MGGIPPAGEITFECLVGESRGEAGLEADLIRQYGKTAWTISYATASETETTKRRRGRTDPRRDPVHLRLEGRGRTCVVSNIRLYSNAKTKKALDNRESTPGNTCL